MKCLTILLFSSACLAFSPHAEAWKAKTEKISVAVGTSYSGVQKLGIFSHVKCKSDQDSIASVTSKHAGHYGSDGYKYEITITGLNLGTANITCRAPSATTTKDVIKFQVTVVSHIDH